MVTCDWDDATTEAQAGLALIEESATEVGAVFANAICAHVAYHRGELEKAQAAVDEARRSLVAGPFEIGFEWVTWIEALLYEADGRAAQADHRRDPDAVLGARQSKRPTVPGRMGRRSRRRELRRLLRVGRQRSIHE